MNTGSSQKTGLIDTHAHLQLEPLVRDPDGAVRRAEFAGIGSVLTVGIDLEDAALGIRISERFDRVFASVGFHPHNARAVCDDALQRMEKLARHAKVKAYGEIGLDYFRNRSPVESQRAVFDEQIRMAKRLDKPLIIHLREAYGEGLEMLESLGPYPARGVIHCFSGNETDARRALDLGFCISFPGNLTYKKNEGLRTILKTLPDDRILLETDCPYLTPEPLRGRSNEPAFMVHTARKMAEVRGVPVEEIARITSKNAVDLFRL